jgi:hypothetical protein
LGGQAKHPVFFRWIEKYVCHSAHKDASGRTPLTIAAFNGNSEATQHLIEKAQAVFSFKLHYSPLVLADISDVF